jgi:signal transduction histidine kinase
MVVASRHFLSDPVQREKIRAGLGPIPVPGSKSGRTENDPVATARKTPKRSKPQSVAADPAEGRVEQLTALLHELDGKRDQERKVLSRELHDTLVATLSATKMECDWLLRSATASEAEVKRRLARVSGSLGEAIAFARRVIDQLWPTVVQHLGLATALRHQLAELKASSGLDLDADFDADLGTLPEAHTMMLYRSVQEALEFCMQQEPPLQPRLHLRRTDTGVELKIEPGAATKLRTRGANPFDGRMLRERALHLGGECELGDAAPEQFQLRLFLPFHS